MISRMTDRRLAVAVAALVVADWASKLWVIGAMGVGETLSVVDGWVYFVHRQNPGVAFSMFADMPAAWRAPVLSAVSVLGVFLFARIIATTSDGITRAAAAIVMGGAIGNLGDRLVSGHVTDFVLVRFFPFVFNLADAAITVGGVLLALRLTVGSEAAEPTVLGEPG